MCNNKGMGTPKTDKEHTESPWAFGMRHRLALALEVSGTSVHEMAEVLEVSPNTVGNYTSGRTTPKHATIAMWAMKTGAPIGWIKTGVDAADDPHQSPDGGDSSRLRESNAGPVLYKGTPSPIIDMFQWRASA